MKQGKGKEHAVRPAYIGLVILTTVALLSLFGCAPSLDKCMRIYSTEIGEPTIVTKTDTIVRDVPLPADTVSVWVDCDSLRADSAKSGMMEIGAAPVSNGGKRGYKVVTRTRDIYIRDTFIRLDTTSVRNVILGHTDKDVSHARLTGGLIGAGVLGFFFVLFGVFWRKVFR